MGGNVCPFWIGYFLLSPFRKLSQNPQQILKSYLKPGMASMDFGSAMGYFSLPMAKMVEPGGKAICVDVQQKMLDILQKRAQKTGLTASIETHLISQSQPDLEKYYNKIDFVLLFAVVHEVPDKTFLFTELAKVLKPGALLLFSEPSGHVTETAFLESIKLAEKCNFEKLKDLEISKSFGALLQRA